MKTSLIFKTNIETEENKADISNVLEKMPDLSQWEIDLAHEYKPLIVHGTNLKAEMIVQELSILGYRIEPMEE